MSENIPVGSTITFRVFLYWDNAAVTGASVANRQFALERLSDGFFWDGATFSSGFGTVTMADLSDGTTHYDGMIEVVITPPVGDGEKVYDWSQIPDPAVAPPTRGRIRTFDA